MQRVISIISMGSESETTDGEPMLGEVVRKLGERVLISVLPIMKEGLSTTAEHREGVALGLAEILSAATDVQLEDHYGVIIPTVRDALCDEDQVRDAHAALDKLFQQAAIPPDKSSQPCSTSWTSI